jgi:hypothetical protein
MDERSLDLSSDMRATFQSRANTYYLPNAHLARPLSLACRIHLYRHHNLVISPSFAAAGGAWLDRFDVFGMQSGIMGRLIHDTREINEKEEGDGF